MGIDQFLTLLRNSGLIDESALTDVGSTTCDVLVQTLLDRKLLTDWHVQKLLQNKDQGFFFRDYKILRPLGRGGMSIVYLAEHRVSRQPVAIKILPKKRLQETGEFLEHFRLEADIGARLDHPHIVRVLEAGQEDDVHYIVTEYFEAETLQSVVERRGPLDFRFAADLIRQAALALAHVHQAGIVHRDVKPGNLLVSATGQVKLFDFGLALPLSRLTLRGANPNVIGTADYIAPEQITDSHTVDGRADLYSLGCVLYFALTGRSPFPTGTVRERLAAHQTAEPEPIAAFRTDISADLLEIWRKLSAKSPDGRFQTAGEVADILKTSIIEHSSLCPL